MTEVKRLEREIRRLRYELKVANKQVPYLRALVEGTSDLLALLDEEGFVQEYNHAFAQKLNVEVAPLFGFNVLRMFVTEDGGDTPLITTANLRRLGTGGQTFHGYWQSGEPVEVSLNVISMQDEIFIVLSARFLSDQAKQARELHESRVRVQGLQKRLSVEREQERAVRLKSLSVLAGALAHDLNNALSIVFGNLELLKDITQDAFAIELISDIFEGSNSARELATRLRTFSKGSSVILTPIYLQPWLTSLIRAMSQSRRVLVALEMPESPCWINGDEAQLTQVLINLITNAFQASGQSPDIKVRLLAGSLLGKRAWVIEVLDRGTGFNDEVIGKIFDPFFSTKQGGSGLGLASSMRIIQAHHGTIEALNREGGGGLLRVVLPAEASMTQGAALNVVAGFDGLKSGHDGGGLLNGRTVLLMDDEPLVRQTFRRALLKAGATFFESSHGEEAMALFKELRRNAVWPVVILDLHIEGGLDGIATLEKMREIEPDIKVIACSGHSDVYVASDHKVLGFADYLAKPFKIATLVSMIQALDD